MLTVFQDYALLTTRYLIQFIVAELSHKFTLHLHIIISNMLVHL